MELPGAQSDAASDEEVQRTPRGEWIPDNEAELVRKHNAGVTAGRSEDAFKTSQLGKTSDPTDNPDVDTSMPIDVEAHDEPAPAPPPGGCIGYLKEWRAERVLEHNKSAGMDPYVVAKLGRYGKVAQTKAYVTKAADPPEVYTNPEWTDEHDRDLCIHRSPNDRGELIVEVYDEGLEKDRFIGSCHVHLLEFIEHAEKTDKWKHVLFHLYDQQDLADSDERSRDAGVVHALVRWVPETSADGTWAVDMRGRATGVLKMKVLAGADLRDVSMVRISDITSFADTGSFQLTFYLGVTFIVFFSLFYRYVVWGNLKVHDDSTHGVDSVLFVLTTFTTVGYGDHPQLLETTFERLVTVVFIILGMGILGVTIGTWGDMIKVKVDQKKRRARERLLKTMAQNGLGISALTGTDDIREQVMTKLRKNHRESDIDEHLIQTEMGKALIVRFWKDELKKLLFGLAGLAGILWLGTAVFLYTEQDECFISETLPENADPACKFPLGYPRAGELIARGRTEKGLSVIDALYFTTVTASTVGYGDVTPQSWMGKLFAIVYIPIAVALMSKTVMSIALIPMEYRRLKLEAYVLDQFGDQLTSADFVDLKSSVNIGPEEPIRKNDFTLAMLLRLGRVGKYDITRIEQIFARLDKDKTGVLDKRDVQNLLALHQKRMEQSKLQLVDVLALVTPDEGGEPVATATNPVATGDDAMKDSQMDDT